MGDERDPSRAREDEEHRADEQQGDPDALAAEGDPRGGLQSEAYRTADPRDLVVEGDTAMSGPGGAPQEERTVEERREAGERRREELDESEPKPAH